MAKTPDREAEIDRLSEDSMRDRLKLAERALIYFGWSATHVHESARDKVANEAWHEWARYLGSDRLDPKRNRDLDERLRDEEERWERHRA